MPSVRPNEMHRILIEPDTLNERIMLYFQRMSGRKKKNKKMPVFDNIRKPTAPPAVRFGKEKAEEKARPALRKTKHKKRYDQTETDVDSQG